METILICQPVMSLTQTGSGYVQDSWPPRGGPVACFYTQALRFQHGFSLLDDSVSLKWKYRCQLPGCEVR